METIPFTRFVKRFNQPQKQLVEQISDFGQIKEFSIFNMPKPLSLSFGKVVYHINARDIRHLEEKIWKTWRAFNAEGSTSAWSAITLPISGSDSVEVKQLGLPHKGSLSKCLSCIMGNYHVQFLGGNRVVMPVTYPVFLDKIFKLKRGIYSK